MSTENWKDLLKQHIDNNKVEPFKWNPDGSYNTLMLVNQSLEGMPEDSKKSFQDVVNRLKQFDKRTKE